MTKKITRVLLLLEVLPLRHTYITVVTYIWKHNNNKSFGILSATTEATVALKAAQDAQMVRNEDVTRIHTVLIFKILSDFAISFELLFSGATETMPVYRAEHDWDSWNIAVDMDPELTKLMKV